MFKNWKRYDWFCFICNNFLVIIGSFLLAIGAAIFLTRLSIVAGGLSGIAIIIQHYVDFQIIDIVVWSLTAILWVVGWFTCGKEFSLRTLLSSIAYPGFLTLMLRVDYFQNIAISPSINCFRNIFYIRKNCLNYRFFVIVQNLKFF